MRPTGSLAAGLALLLAAGVAAAWLLPGQLDAEQYRAPLQRLASRTLGAPVRLGGPIHLRLLPRPTLEAGNLEVGNLTAQGLRLRLALAPLLAGRIEAQSLLLYRPDLRLPTPLDPRALLRRRPAWIGGATTRIEDGRVEVGGVTLSGIDARLATEPLTGDLAASGAATESGRAWSFALRLTQPGGDGAAGIELSLAGADALRGTAATLSGQLAADGSLQGHAAAHGADLSRLLPAPALAFSAAGRVSVAGELAEADEVVLQLGGSPASGAVALRLGPTPRLDLALAASRLDLDPWLALLRGGGDGWATLPVGVDLSAEAGTLRGGTVRGLRAAFDLLGGRVSVRELRATLPGDAALRATGSADAARFEGDASLAAPAWPVTRGFLASLLRGAAGALMPPATAIELSAHVVADRAGVALSRIAGTLDGGHVSGMAAWRRAAAPAAMQLSATLRMDSLPLDRWLAGDVPAADLDLRVDARRARWRGFSAAPLQLDIARQQGAWTLRGLQAVAGPLRVTAAGRLSAAGRVDDGRLTVDAEHLSAVARLPGMSGLTLPPEAPLAQAALHAALQASGVPRALSGSLQASLGELTVRAQARVELSATRFTGTVTLRAPSARQLLGDSRLLRRAGLPAPESDAVWLGEGSLSASAECSGTADSLALTDIAVVAGSLRATASLQAGWAGEAPSLSGRIDAQALPLPPWSSALADALLAGTPVPGEAALSLHADRVLIGLRPLVVPFVGELAWSKGRLRMDGMQAGLAGGTGQGSAALDLAAEPPRVAIQVSLQHGAIAHGLTGLPVDIVGGLASGQASLAGAGHSVSAMLQSLQGEATLHVSDGSLGGVGLAGLPPDLPALAVAAALSGGSTAFSRVDLAIRVDHGLASLDAARLDLSAGGATLAGSYDLAQQAADLALTFRPVVPASPPDLAVPPPAIGLRLLGSGSHVQRIAELAPLARWRAARDQQP